MDGVQASGVALLPFAMMKEHRVGDVQVPPFPSTRGHEQVPYTQGYFAEAATPDGKLSMSGRDSGEGYRGFNRVSVLRLHEGRARLDVFVIGCCYVIGQQSIVPYKACDSRFALSCWRSFLRRWM